MLTLQKLEIEGFGPYETPQVLEFPTEPGVTLVYGENMTGKTSLLNAVRYAFFGKVLGRGSRQRRVHTLSNRARAARREFGFKVGLSFNNDGEEFELVRTCVPIAEIPVRDSEYEQSFKLRRGPAILGPDQREAVLARVLPEEISRFFLFDGELLQEYEKLLYENDDEGHRISEAIERILGVPLLKRSRAHLAALADEADRAAAKEASKSKNTEALGTALKAAMDRKKFHQDEIARVEGTLTELRSQKADAEAFLATQKKWLTIMQERDQAESRVLALAEEIGANEQSLREAMAHGWRTLLAGTVASAREEATRRAARVMDEMIADLRRRAVLEGHCDVCEQDVDGTQASRLRDPDGGASPDVGADAAAELLDLSRVEVRDVSDIVSHLTRQLAKARGETARLKDVLKDMNTALSDADVDRVQSDAANLGEVMEKIAEFKRALDGHREKVVESESSISNLKANLAKFAPTNLRGSQARSLMLRQATEVFAEAVDGYKRELRGRVEATASDLFLAMSTEKDDYAGLQISDGYGLHLVHRDQTIEDGRSAGAEHVIALALMGSLQANAPIRGPIIIDSPFGRLDPGHRSNVIATLPAMADQVVLLVHRGEVRQHQVREILGSRLVREYEMRKVSSRCTTIERVR